MCNREVVLAPWPCAPCSFVQVVAMKGPPPCNILILLYFMYMWTRAVNVYRRDGDGSAVEIQAAQAMAKAI